MKSRIKDIDNGYKKVYKLLKEGPKGSVSVGILAKEGAKQHENSNLSVLEIASFHEFGLGNNPERSFIRAWVDQNVEKITSFLSKEYAAAVKARQESFDKVWERLGLFAQAGIQSRMSDGIPPPLKPATIARKGSSVPLIDTGQLRSSITYKVNKG